MLSPWELAFGRWFIASLILLPFTFGKFKTCFNQLIKHKWLILWLALSGVVIDNTLIYYAGRTASAINMGLLNITGPIFLVILSRIFLKTPIFSKTSYRIAYRHCWRPCHNSAWQYFTANKIKLRSWRFLHAN